MNGSKVFIDLVARMKPILIKIFPQDLLRIAKQKWLTARQKKIKNLCLEPYVAIDYKEGINLIGNIKGSSGLGQSARLLANALEATKYPIDIVQHSISDMLNNSDSTYDEKLVESGKYGINIFHINMHEFALAFSQLGRDKWDKHYNIAFWLWELEEFPDEWVDCINVLDEIWTPAEFVSESIRKKTDKPVYTIPYHVTAPIDEKYDREYFGLPKDKFLFLMLFDSGSMIERKNPKAVIDAYKLAFDKQDDAGLVIKMNGYNEADVKYLQSQLDGYENIHIITESFSKVEVNSLIRCVDVVVSLHRAEGFGLVLAEAMLNETPCIATNWSANTEFMNEDVACMVDYELIEIEKQIGPYAPGNYWADANIKQAAKYMRKLFDDSQYYEEVKCKAKNYIDEKLNLDNIANLIEERIKQIQENH